MASYFHHNLKKGFEIIKNVKTLKFESGWDKEKALYTHCQQITEWIMKLGKKFSKISKVFEDKA